MLLFSVSPRDLDCPDYVLIIKGSVNVQITCRVRANPHPVVTWHLPDGSTADNPRNYDACMVLEEVGFLY